LQLAEAPGKEILVALLRDLTPNDPDAKVLLFPGGPCLAPLRA
jgi:hypothetical protein